MDERALRASEVERMAGLSRTTIWRRERDGTFPRRRRSGGIVYWLETEVREWLRAQPAAEDSRPRPAA